MPVTEIALALGYDSSQNFARMFRLVHSMTPTEPGRNLSIGADDCPELGESARNDTPIPRPAGIFWPGWPSTELWRLAALLGQLRLTPRAPVSATLKWSHLLKNLTCSISLLALTLAWGVPVHAEVNAQARTVASFPAGTFLENLHASTDGRTLITSYFDKTILQWSGDSKPVPLAVLDAHPVGVLVRPQLVVLSVHGQPFTAGEAFTKTNAFMTMNRDGSGVRTYPVPNALFLNGLVDLGDRHVLAADSLAGKIWRFDTVSGRIDEWLSDPQLTTDPARPRGTPGANGLKIHDGWLYVSNSSRQSVYRVALKAGEPTGKLALFANTGPIDDFNFLADGTLVATSHGKSLYTVNARGETKIRLQEGCDGCTAVLPHGASGTEVLVLTTGNLLEGGRDPARLLLVNLPR